MATQATKMFALFALLALCASAATAAFVPQCFSPITAMATIDPCMQYCMMAFTSPAAMTMQQCGMQAMMPSVMTTLQQCNCAAIWQMMRQQQYMSAAMQLPFTFGAMTPFAFFQQPFAGGAIFQQPFLGCGF